MSTPFALADAGFAVLTVVLLAVPQLRRPGRVRSSRLEERVKERLEAMGYRGDVEVSVDRTAGGRWQLTLYRPYLGSPPQVDGRADPVLEAAASAEGLPRRYWWGNRTFHYLALVSGILAAIFAYLALARG